MTVEGAEDRVRNWAVIAQAEGVLSGRYTISLREAAQLLALDAQSSGRLASEVARELLASRRVGTGRTCRPTDATTRWEWHECGGADG